MRTYYPVLTIAGSDPSGGAGIQADIKTISAIGCYAMSAITAITAQNTTGVRSVMPVPTAMVAEQIDMVMTDIPPLAVKIGMLCSAEIASTVADSLDRYHPNNIVLDPVMLSSSGTSLLEKEAIDIIVKRIFPLTTLVTPNLDEARELTGENDPVKQIEILHEMGCSNVLITGGDSQATDFKTDILSTDGRKNLLELRADAVSTRNTHGTGCTLSSAVASYLAVGNSLTDSVRLAKLYVTNALKEGSFVSTGKGHGPLNHFFSPRRLKNFNPNRPKS